MKTMTLETVAATLNALPGVTASPMAGRSTHLSLTVAGRFVAMAWVDKTGRICVYRDTGRKLGPAVYAAVKSLAPCHID